MDIQKLLLGTVFAFVLISMDLQASGQETVSIKSPDGFVQLRFESTNGQLHYAASTLNGSIASSTVPLGFSFAHADAFRTGLRMREISKKTKDVFWKHPVGSNGMIRNHYNESVIEVRENTKGGRKLFLEARVYDDGVAFRFVFPDDFSIDSIFITQEHTSFKFEPKDSAYWAPYNDFAYESLYRYSQVGSAAAASTPMTIRKQNGMWAAIHEAALIDYSEMYLKPIPNDSGTFETALHPWPDGIACRAKGKYQTPWRCILIEKEAAGLLTSNLIQNLNEPTAIADLSWIKPIRFIGIWWGMHIGKHTWTEGPDHGATTERAKEYIDFAAANGIEGVLVEGWNKGWETWATNQTPLQQFTTATADFNLEVIANYAKSKGVQLIGHHETGGNIPEYEKQMESAFALYQKLGIHYVKTGYAGPILPDGLHHHGQYMVRHFQQVVELAAKYQICLDVHESIKPTGLDRTWPNLLTQEAVRGNEWNATYKANPPAHSVTLPFTRGLAGPFDYTPGIFNTNHSPEKNKKVPTLITHQIAQCVIFNSPMMMFADEVEHYTGHPLTPMLSKIEAAWDTTIVLAAQPGQHIAVARRHRKQWLVAGLSGNTANSIWCNLSFLDQNQSYKASIVFDTPLANMEQSPEKYDTISFVVNATDSLPFNMLPGGGFLMKLEPLNDINFGKAQRSRYLTIAPKLQRIFAARKTYGDMREPHLAIGKPVKRFQPFNGQYPAAGAIALNDGLRGGLDFSAGGWQGYLGTGVDISIDLGYVDTLARVKIGFLEAKTSWIFFPDEVELSYSKDGVIFQNVKRLSRPIKSDSDANEHHIYEFDFSGLDINARFVRIRTHGATTCPNGHPGEGKPSWMFADEILVYRK